MNSQPRHFLNLAHPPPPPASSPSQQPPRLLDNRTPDATSTQQGDPYREQPVSMTMADGRRSGGTPQPSLLMPGCTTGIGSSSVSQPPPLMSGMPGGMPTQPFPGAINLTIANGAINIKPVDNGQNTTRADVQHPISAVFKASIGSNGPASRMPMIPQQQAALNLKIPNPLNIRMTNPVTLNQGMRAPPALTSRPAMLINHQQFRPHGLQNPPQLVTHAPLGQLTSQAFAQVLPGSGGPFLSQGMQLPQGARLLTQVPFAPMQDSNQNLAGRGPLRMQPPPLHPFGAPIQTMKTTNVSGSMPFPPPHGAFVTSPMMTSMMTSPISMVPPTNMVSSMPLVSTCTLLPTGQPMVAFANSTAGATQMSLAGLNLQSPAVTMTSDSASGGGRPGLSPLKAIAPKPGPKGEGLGGKDSLHGAVGKRESAASATEADRKDGEGKRVAGSGGREASDSSAAEAGAGAGAPTPGSDDFDPMKAMDWDNGIGTLQGSNLKFHVNEFGLMEVVTEGAEAGQDSAPPAGDNTAGQGTSPRNSVHDENSNKSKDDAEAMHTNGESRSSDDIRRCAACRRFGVASDFRGRFCSQLCEASDNSHDAMAPGSLGGSGSAKAGDTNYQPRKKKRKLTTEGEAAGEGGVPSRQSRSEDDTCSEGKRSTSSFTSVTARKNKAFSWSQYLEQEKARAAPDKLFRDNTGTKNSFRVGTRLEGVDPKHPSLYCVLTVAEIKGHRLRLHFDGYSECHDFWTDADSPFIFPAGWSEKNGKKLQPPKGYKLDDFSWADYLKQTKTSAAQKSIFTTTNVVSVTPHGFRVGMKLEAVDKKNSALTCVATVADVLGDRFLIHFDGWEDIYDYWCEPSSPYIHPVGWCQQNLKPLSPPNDWKDISSFTWEDYLSQTQSQLVPARHFKNRPANMFEAGMKLEAVDRRNPILIRVATVADSEPHRVKIHFDGWSDIYDYWLDDDSSDLHPAGWCQSTGHPLAMPIGPREIALSPGNGGCPTPGCSGVGHIKGAKYTGHHSAFGCPYSPMNMNKECAIQDRLGPSRETLESVMHAANVKPAAASRQFSEDGVDRSPTHGHSGKKRDSLMKISVLLNNGKPLYGPGSGRGRKKNKILKLIQKQKELERAAKVEATVEGPPGAEAETASGSLQRGIHQSVFMSAVLCSPSRDLPLCWEQHCKLLPGVDKFRAEDVAAWSVTSVARFVSNLPGCRHLGSIFVDEQIDGEAFLLMNQADIVRILNVKLGPALKVHNAILTIKNNLEV